MQVKYCNWFYPFLRDINMNKIFTLILACCLICFSCSKENIEGSGFSSDNNDGKTELAELTVLFSLPQTTSRANDFDNPPTMEGTDAENTVSSAMIIMGEMVNGINAPTVISQRYIIDKLVKVEANSSTLWKGVIKVNPGYYRIVAIANPPLFLKLKENLKPGASWQKLSDYSVRLSAIEKLNEISTDNSFMMTNAHTAGKSEFDVEVKVGRKNQALINVQRVCARIDYIPRNSPYNLSLSSGHVPEKDVEIEVKFTHVAPVNISRDFYLFKTISFDEKGLDKTFYASEDENNYVADANWSDKWFLLDKPSNSFQTRIKNNFFSNTEIINRDESIDKVRYSPLPEHESKIFYLTENTLPGIETQVNKLSTGILFKAEFEFTDPEFKGQNDVYYYQTKGGEKKIYKSLDVLKDDLKADNMIENPEAWNGSDKEIAQCKARKFTKADNGKFYAWYSYWNRHRDNGNNNVMGKMEFAVVRNNIYKLSISSVNSLGYPEEPTGSSVWKPAGETPDELPLMLDVKVKVSDWVNRVYDYEI